MINFIKDAVTAVSGIKTFLFNTDYRNNFDLQDVEFPCCVLTPIMRTNYDLNNIIRESAELQLSVVESAPYDYSGDDLYDINKRCSDLALQVIANLQVKSKLDKELTFEFILPSGDELISGVMCNLQCTMKQGSCIGAPSYVEVIVQPIKRESITSNGKHIITPSKGYDAMREVEVDVNIDELTTEEKVVDITSNGGVEILPTKADAMTKVTATVQVPPPPLEEKQVTITKAKTTEIITPDAEYGLSRVEVLTDIPLESKQITITENGTTTIEASEGFEGIENVEVTTDVNTLQGLNFEGVFDQEQANDINQYYKDGLEYAEDVVEIVKNAKEFNMDSFNGERLIFFPKVDMTHISRIDMWLTNAKNLIYISKDLDFSKTDLYRPFDSCIALRALPIIDCSSTTNMRMFAENCPQLAEIYIVNTAHIESIYGIFYGNKSLKVIVIDSVMSCKDFVSGFGSNGSLQMLEIKEWKQGDISLIHSSLLTSKSIHYIIQNAMNVADGATARILTLHATAKKNWQNSEYYEQDLAVLSTKGITIA